MCGLWIDSQAESDPRNTAVAKLEWLYHYITETATQAIFSGFRT